MDRLIVIDSWAHWSPEVRNLTLQMAFWKARPGSSCVDVWTKKFHWLSHVITMFGLQSTLLFLLRMDMHMDIKYEYIQCIYIYSILIDYNKHITV